MGSLADHVLERGAAHQQKTRLVALANPVATVAYPLNQQTHIIHMSGEHDELCHIQ